MIRKLLLLTVPSMLIFLLFGELFFRWVVPAAEWPWGYYDPVDHIARFEDGQGSGVLTIGALARQRGRWQINNAGWNSDIDYLPPGGRTRPLIAVLGDSYIEALQVDTSASVVAKLRERVDGQYDVYGFGKSGAPLSQYLQMSRYVDRRFNPAVLVINVVHNDFDESLVTVTHFPYFLGVRFRDGQPAESELTDSAIRTKTRTKMFLASAVVRYFWFNLRLGNWLMEHGVALDENRAAAHEPAEGTGEDIRLQIAKATDYLVRAFREENAGRELIFVMDAPRREIYAGRTGRSSVLWMNRLLKDVTARYGCRFIDLTEPFTLKYEHDRVRFNTAADYHWNDEGHRAAAEVVYENLVTWGLAR